MTGVSGSVAVLCCSMFVAAVVKMLSPSGSTEKVLRIVISLFILICITSCFKTVAESVGLTDDFLENSKYTEAALDENVLKVTGDYMAEYIKSLLEAEGIEAELIKVTVDADEKNVINITDVSIYIDKDDFVIKSKSEEILENYLGITPKIFIGE